MEAQALSTDVVRLGIVGCGGISHAHGKAAQKIPAQLKFVACCDVREEAAQSWAEHYGCEAVYADYEEMIREEALDGILLATWPVQHREQIERCLEAGTRNILCEKALALSGSEAVEIWQMAGQAGALVMEAFMYRHHPAIARLERILALGELGPLDSVRACFHHYDPETARADDPARNWRLRKDCGGGVPYDYACYSVNACGHFAGGLPVQVYCGGGVSAKYDVINRMYGLIEYDNERIGIIESSKTASLNQELQLTCARGILNLPVAWALGHGDVVITQRQDGPWPLPVADTFHVRTDDPYRLQLTNFADAVRGKAKPLLPLVESVVNAYALEALVQSLTDKRIVAIELPDRVQQAFAASHAG